MICPITNIKNKKKKTLEKQVFDSLFLNQNPSFFSFLSLSLISIYFCIYTFKKMINNNQKENILSIYSCDFISLFSKSIYNSLYMLFSIRFTSHTQFYFRETSKVFKLIMFHSYNIRITL